MQTDDVVKIISSMPDLRDQGEQYWTRVVAAVAPMVVDEIVTAHDFDFALNTYSLTWPATAEQTLTGEDNDLRDIVAIRYGSDNDVLQRMRLLDALDFLQNGGSIGSVAAWYQSGTDNAGMPKVTLIDTPTTSATVRVTYRKKDLTIRHIPDEFGYVLVEGILSTLYPARRRLFERALRKMIYRHKVGGKDYMQVSADPHIVGMNQDVADLYGTG